MVEIWENSNFSIKALDDDEYKEKVLSQLETYFQFGVKFIELSNQLNVKNGSKHFKIYLQLIEKIKKSNAHTDITELLKR